MIRISQKLQILFWRRSNITLILKYLFIVSLRFRSSTDSISYETVSNVFLPVTSETGSLAASLSKAFSEKSDTDEIISNTYFSNLPAFLPFVFMRFMWKTNEKVQAKILKVNYV